MGDYNSDFNRGYNNFNGIGNRPERPTNGTIDGDWAAWRKRQASITPFPKSSTPSSPGVFTSVAPSSKPSVPTLSGGAGYSSSNSPGFWSFLFSIPGRLIKLTLYLGFFIGIWGQVEDHIDPRTSYGMIFNFMNHVTGVAINKADQMVPVGLIQLERLVIGVALLGLGFVGGAAAAVGNVVGHIGIIACQIAINYLRHS